MEIIQKFVDISIENYISLATPDWDPLYISKAEITDSRFIDTEKPEKDGLLAWKATDSFITDNEILEVEKELLHSLPESFKFYLKYKNFYDLDMLSDVWLFKPLIPKVWKEKILDSTFNGYPREFVYDKGLIPFANYSDWGLTCFNTNKSTDGSEYEIVVWDHENPTEFEVKAENFQKLLGGIVDDFENGEGDIVIIN